MAASVDGALKLQNGHVNLSQSSPTLSPPSSSSSSSAFPHDPPLQTLTSTLGASPYTFLLPPEHLHSAALQLVKGYLDPLAASVSFTQRARYLEGRDAGRRRGRRQQWERERERENGLGQQVRKRKWCAGGDGEEGEEEDEGMGEKGGDDFLRLQSVHVDGFGTDQVWGQAKRVLEAVCREVEREVRVLEREVGGLERGSELEDDEDESEEDEDEDEGDESEEGEEGEDEGEDEDEDIDRDNGYKGVNGKASPKGKLGRSLGGATLDKKETLSDASSDIHMDEATWNDGDNGDNVIPPQSYTADPHGLNDGFFSIDDFNRQSEFLERVDARGDPDDGAASDEEDVDWTMDPLAMDTEMDELDNDEDDNDDEDNANIHYDRRNLIKGNARGGSDGSSIDEDDINGVNVNGNANNILYKDFFEPPAKRKNKNRDRRSDARNNTKDILAPPKEATIENNFGQDEIERAMSTVQRDLFDDESSAESIQSENSEKNAVAISNLSSHQRRQARLVEQIRRLEAENVAKREWTLTGEAKANERPLNSLLEEDLDFERLGKPAPVITAEVSEDLETLIKRRIIDREFDELRRYQPGALLPGQDVRRGRVQLDDSKPKKGLADEYEEEHLRRTDPNFVDVKDEKLRAKHREIENLWREASGKLDALASWHYRPKPAEASFEVRVDAPAITMEDAQPTAGSEVAGASRLAPQEIYAPGKQYVDSSEVVTKGGSVIKRDEMTREQKKRRRRREKERLRKASGNPTVTAATATTNGVRTSKGKAEERSKILTDLKKGGVKVIGKKGELKSIDEKKTEPRMEVTVGSLKL